MTAYPRYEITPFLLAGALLIFAGAGLALFDAPSQPVPQPAKAVLLELFTSQGCSSCPPADRLLSALGEDEALRGRVIPLAYHVDYWNHIGWRDPFSSAAWSDRQGDYAQALQTGRLYTPQLVVNGRRDFVGSDERQAHAAIAEALSTPPAADVQLSATPVPDDVGRLYLDVAVTLNEAVETPSLDVMIAVFENGLSTDVRSGENARRTLKNDHVVRSLERGFSLPTAPDVRHAEQITLDLPTDAHRDRLGIAVFLQDPASMRIYGASALDLSTVF